MTQEEKAKAYDKALVIARSRYSTETEESVRICLELMFPELKESEDERIRKAITEFFKNYSENGTWKAIPDVTKWIAWLEKQGEKKSIDDLTPQEAMDIAVAKCFEQGEQKPIKEHDICNTCEEKASCIIPCPMKLVEQKPAWSEWDRILQDSSISYLCNLRDSFETKGWDKEQIQKCISWLQSLKPQLQWKPTEEQMKQLGWIVKQNKDNIIGKELMALYNDLQKLSQGLEYKDGSIKPIESMSEDCELTFFESELYSVVSYFWQAYSSGEEVNLYKFVKEHAPELLDAVARDKENKKPSIESFDYKHADIPQKDFTSRIDPGFKINLPFEKDYQKLEWPPTIKFDEPDIEEMVEDFWHNKDVIMSSHTRGMVEEAYRQGLEDMWNKIRK